MIMGGFPLHVAGSPMIMGWFPLNATFLTLDHGRAGPGVVPG
jgi:hypothetical protein